MCFSKQKLVVVIIELRMILEFTHIPTKGKKRYMELCCSPALTLCSNSSWTQRKSSLCDYCSCCPPSRWGQREQANGAALSCPLNSIKNLWKQTTDWCRSMQRVGKWAQAVLLLSALLSAYSAAKLWRCAWGDMNSKYLLTNWSGACSILLLLDVHRWRVWIFSHECIWAHHPQGSVQCKLVSEHSTACEQTWDTSGLKKRAGSELYWQSQQHLNVFVTPRSLGKENSWGPGYNRGAYQAPARTKPLKGGTLKTTQK